MRNYLLFIFIALIFVFALILVVRLFNKPDEILKTNLSEEEFSNAPSDSSISDYFKEGFEKKKLDSEGKDSDLQKNTKTCELMGEVVSQGAVIFDSTCQATQ